MWVVSQLGTRAGQAHQLLSTVSASSATYAGSCAPRCGAGGTRHAFYALMRISSGSGMSPSFVFRLRWCFRDIQNAVENAMQPPQPLARWRVLTPSGVRCSRRGSFYPQHLDAVTRSVGPRRAHICSGPSGPTCTNCACRSVKNLSIRPQAELPNVQDKYEVFRR